MKLLILIVWMLCFTISFCQSKTVTGKVMDESGKPLVRALIINERHNRFAFSDSSGNYSIANLNDSDILKCRYTDYSEKMEAVKSNTIISFVLSRMPVPTTTIVESQEVVSRNKPAEKKLPIKVTLKEPEEDDYQPRFSTIETDAKFPKKEGGFQKYIERNIQCPDSCTAGSWRNSFDSYRIEILVEFEIDVDGYIKNPVLLRGQEKCLNDAVIKVLLSSPLWEPAFFNGKNVSSKQRLEINFLLHPKKRGYRNVFK